MYRQSFPLSTINNDYLTKSHYKLASYINNYKQSVYPGIDLVDNFEDPPIGPIGFMAKSTQ
jgi:hypothetical protein